MSNYNLKAKLKDGGEIIEFTAYDNHFGSHKYGYKANNSDYVYNEDKFYEHYEVIDDTPIEKGWEEEFNKLFLSTEIRMIREGKSIYETNGVAIKEFIERVEQSAYNRGQADAYKRSEEVVMKTFTDLEGVESYQIWYNHAKVNIAQAIEQLASKKE